MTALEEIPYLLGNEKGEDGSAEICGGLRSRKGNWERKMYSSDNFGEGRMGVRAGPIGG